MAVMEKRQSEMLSFVINLNRRKANNDHSFLAYSISNYNSFPESNNTRLQGDEILKLRDENGFPVWSGWRRR